MTQSRSLIFILLTEVFVKQLIKHVDDQDLDISDRISFSVLFSSIRKFANQSF